MMRDPETGLVYVEEDYCLACGECTLACPFEEPRIRPHPESGTALKCDLCRGRPQGPICVEYCPVEALTFRPAA
jgi:Fe-S-cluster-containing hydrogenase component 2